jgi:hypothetical protein
MTRRCKGSGSFLYLDTHMKPIAIIILSFSISLVLYLIDVVRSRFKRDEYTVVTVNMTVHTDKVTLS